MRFDSGVDDEIINDIVINDNGKILAVGTRTNTLFVSKINSDGTLDLSFNSVGYKLFPLPSGDGAVGISIHNYLGNYLLVGSNKVVSFYSEKFLFIMNFDYSGILINSYGNNGLKTISLASSGSTTASYTMLDSKLFQDRLYITFFFMWSFNYQYNELVKYNLSTNAYSSVCTVPTEDTIIF